jgi:small subunit ribosomal protein S1
MPPEIILAEHSGFCFGVERAISLAEKALSSGRKGVYSLGPIIHNPREIGRLEDIGLNVVSNLDSVDSGILIIRSHGAHPNVFKQAREKGLKIVDSTCPFVKRLHEIAGMLGDEGYRVAAAGERDHPEVMALAGVEVVENAADALKIKKSKKIGVVSQTTQSAENFREIVSALTRRAKELRVFNTICSATEKRQASALKLSKKTDIMIVVGGYNSANTRRLREICTAAGAPTKHIESAVELELEELKTARVIGVTAGASTPGWIVEEVMEKLRGLP